MKLKAPILTKGKRDTLERTTKWLLNLVSELSTMKARLDELNHHLEKAESRKAESEKDAALSPDAALTLAGAEKQISRLAPDIEKQQQALERQSATAIHQVNLVWSTEVRELLYGPLLEQLAEMVATAISPFFPADWAKQYSRQIIQQNCLQYRQIMAYLNRPPLAVTEFEDAQREIAAFVGELNKILAGETLVEV